MGTEAGYTKPFPDIKGKTVLPLDKSCQEEKAKCHPLTSGDASRAMRPLVKIKICGHHMYMPPCWGPHPCDFEKWNRYIMQYKAERQQAGALKLKYGFRFIKAPSFSVGNVWFPPRYIYIFTSMKHCLANKRHSRDSDAVFFFFRPAQWWSLDSKKNQDAMHKRMPLMTLV